MVKLGHLATVSGQKQSELDINAVLTTGIVPAQNPTHLMLLRRITKNWVNNAGVPISNEFVYGLLCKEVGYYV